jgi:hypothetical protein
MSVPERPQIAANVIYQQGQIFRDWAFSLLNGVTGVENIQSSSLDRRLIALIRIKFPYCHLYVTLS